MQASDIYDTVIGQIYHWANNFHRNLFHMFDDMNMTRYIRLIACVGAYLLLRPYFVKIGVKIQEKEYEKQSRAAKAKDPYSAAVGKDGKKKITPNSLRGGKTVSFQDEEGEDEGMGSGSGSGNGGMTDIVWGKKARQRQRRAVDKLLETKEERLREDDEEEKDVMELLVDYEEGEDGW